MKRASGLAARTVASHFCHSSVSRAFRHSMYWRRERIANIVRARQLRARRGLVVLHAVNAVAVAALWRPAIREDAVDLVHLDDLAMDRVHELEVVRAERARHPQIAVRPVPQRLAGPRHGNPVRMRLSHVVTDRMRIRARDDAHAELAAAGDKVAERIGLAEPGSCDGAAAPSSGSRRRCRQRSASRRRREDGGSSRARTAGRSVRGRFQRASAAPTASAHRTSPLREVWMASGGGRWCCGRGCRMRQKPRRP